MTKTKAQKARARARANQVSVRRSAPQPQARRRPRRSRGNGNSNNLQRASSLQLTSPQSTASTPFQGFTSVTGTTPGGVRVRGREMIGTVNATGLIANGAYTLLRVGGAVSLLLVPSSFPRLSAYTPIYEFYKFKFAKFTFISNQPTSAAGTMMAAIEHDVTDTAANSSVQLMRNICSVMSNVYSTFSLSTTESLARLPRYITASDNNANAAQIQQARLDIAIEGMTTTAAASFGYLTVEYDVEFFTPQ